MFVSVVVLCLSLWHNTHVCVCFCCCFVFDSVAYYAGVCLFLLLLCI